ncbi:MAG: hypothetical protein JWO89_3362, partial [Verrucomicrobiaceae bacterium]|nr:hypothetical protein [Verrucomicrobiaceae bacterium]
VVSEDVARIPTGAHLVEAASSPVVALKLLQRWQQNRPPGLTGIIWYRLPVEGEKRNWSWPQLQAVIHGQTPEPRWEARLVPQAEGYENVVIDNTGNGDALMPSTISLQTDKVLAFDGANGYNGREVEHGLIFSAANQKPLAAGGHASIGWVRRENLKGVYQLQPGL